MPRCVTCCAVAAVLAAGVASQPIVAARAEEPAALTPAWQEVAAGAEVTRTSWSTYTTMTMAPFGALAEDGFRLRTAGGYGRYRYDGTRRVRGRDVDTTFKGSSSFTDVLIGVQARSGPAIFKLFAGGAAISHVISPFDAGNLVTGLDVAFKGALETWIELGEPWWASLDVSMTGAHQTYAGRIKLGWRLQPELSLGIEAGLHGNATYDGGRSGGFVRWAPSWGELTVSAGITGRMRPEDGDDDLDAGWVPYAGINWLMKY